MGSTWYEKAVFYHIYPLGLLGAPKQNTEGAVFDGMSELECWIPHMKALGCTGLYIGPLFESSSHGYDTKDYKLVDRRLGTIKDSAVLSPSATMQESVWWWTACSTIPDVNFLPFRI